MAKRREIGALDPKLRLQGVIPWTAEGLLDTIEHVHSIHTDDPNQLALAVALHLRERYEGDAALAHAERFMKAVEFIAVHRERLIREGLVADGSTGEDDDTIGDNLFHALATSRYTRRVRSREHTSGWEYRLDVEHVIELARRIGGE